MMIFLLFVVTRTVSVFFFVAVAAVVYLRAQEFLDAKDTTWNRFLIFLPQEKYSRLLFVYGKQQQFDMSNFVA